MMERAAMPARDIALLPRADSPFLLNFKQQIRWDERKTLARAALLRKLCQPCRIWIGTRIMRRDRFSALCRIDVLATALARGEAE